MPESRDSSILTVKLALTQTIEEEEAVKSEIINKGYKCCVTEIGGNVNGWKEKAVRNVLGAALHHNVIIKESNEVHALMHALAEAEAGAIQGAPLASNIAAKVGVVRSEKWICVVIFGDYALHSISHHDRLGFGMMHI